MNLECLDRYLQQGCFSRRTTKLSGGRSNIARFVTLMCLTALAAGAFPSWASAQVKLAGKWLEDRDEKFEKLIGSERHAEYEFSDDKTFTYTVQTKTTKSFASGTWKLSSDKKTVMLSGKMTFVSPLETKKSDFAQILKVTGPSTMQSSNSGPKIRQK